MWLAMLRWLAVALVPRSTHGWVQTALSALAAVFLLVSSEATSAPLDYRVTFTVEDVEGDCPTYPCGYVRGPVFSRTFAVDSDAIQTPRDLSVPWTSPLLFTAPGLGSFTGFDDISTFANVFIHGEGGLVTNLRDTFPFAPLKPFACDQSVPLGACLFASGGSFVYSDDGRWAANYRFQVFLSPTLAARVTGSYALELIPEPASLALLGVGLLGLGLQRRNAMVG